MARKFTASDMITINILDLILWAEIEKLQPYIFALTKLCQTAELPPADAIHCHSQSRMDIYCVGTL
jgi:hypothetical protein